MVDFKMNGPICKEWNHNLKKHIPKVELKPTKTCNIVHTY